LYLGHLKLSTTINLLNQPIITSSGGGRGRLAGARAPARKFFPASPFVKYLKF